MNQLHPSTLPYDAAFPNEGHMVRVVAPHFVAGIVFTDGRVTRAAPILKWLRGKTEDEVRSQIRRHGWRASIIK